MFAPAPQEVERPGEAEEALDVVHRHGEPQIAGAQIEQAQAGFGPPAGELDPADVERDAVDRGDPSGVDASGS